MVFYMACCQWCELIGLTHPLTNFLPIHIIMHSVSDCSLFFSLIRIEDLDNANGLSLLVYAMLISVALLVLNYVMGWAYFVVCGTLN